MNLCTTITSKERTIRIFLYFFTCHHCLNIHVLINTFKCTGQSSSICMTAMDDTDELEGAFVITFDKVSKRMSLYEYVYVGTVHKSFQ